MGGVAKSVGSVASKGKGGENQGPSENTIKNAMIYPELRDPAFRAISDATRLYQQGYSIPRINQRQLQGVESIEDWAGQFGNQLGDVSGNVTNIARGNRAGDAPGTEFLRSMYGGPTGEQPGDEYLESVMGGQNAPKEGWDTLRQASETAQQGSRGLEWLQDTAGGKFLGANPYLNDVISTMNRGTKDAYGNTIAGLEGNMSRAGGMGGSMEALLRGRENEGLARSLAENEANVRYADYGKERGYQESARQALPGAFATEIGTMTGAGGAYNQAAMNRANMRMNAAGQVGQNNRSDLARQMEAANLAGQGYRNDIAQQLGAASQMPGLGTAGFMPGSQLMNAGEYTRANLERQNNAGWEGLQKYLGSLGGVHDLFSQTGASAEQGPDAGSQLAGNAMQMAMMGMMFSDARLKVEVELVAPALYRWRYVWGGPRYEGPLAQDVPGAVPGPGGYLMIPASLIREVPDA